VSERSFLGDILGRVARASRGRRKGRHPSPIELCADILGEKSEVSGMVAALDLLDGFERLEKPEKVEFFHQIVARFGVDNAALKDAIANWSPDDDDAARHIHLAAEPASQELIRRLNRVPGATERLVRMRADLLTCLKEHPELAGLDDDFRHLFLSWFNRGFLQVRRIDWSTSAQLLEKIIAYEAVHAITDWDDLRQRVAAPDRCLYAFFHPAMPSEPLIFVEVALTTNIPNAIAPILDNARDPIDPNVATTAVFYSISNCQKGLRGISFGNFLIKQVVSELQKDFATLKKFVTLSPVPGLRKWAEQALEEGTLPVPIEDLPDDMPQDMVKNLAAYYLLQASRNTGTALDSVAHFHLGNGAILHQINPDADLSTTGQKNAWGVMVNYLYDGDKTEANHQAYATNQARAASPDVRRLARVAKK
jgi:malonyl-CoA decarboxylase